MNTRLLPALALAAILPLAAFPRTANAQLAHADGNIFQSVEHQLQPALKSYSIDAAIQAGGGVTFDDFGPDLPSRHTQANSLADRLGLHSHTFAQLITPPLGTFNDYSLISDANTSITYQDVVLSGPTSGTTSTVVHFQLSGSHLAGSSAIPGFGQTFATSLVNISVFINGADIADGVHSDSVVSGGAHQIAASGLLASWDTTNDFVTPAFNVQVGVPFTVKLFLHTQATVEGFPYNNAGFTAEANTDFSHTFSFSTTSPVFTLPSGFTATSAQAGILNNTFLVPEPASLTLLAAPLLLLLKKRPRTP